MTTEITESLSYRKVSHEPGEAVWCKKLVDSNVLRMDGVKTPKAWSKSMKKLPVVVIAFLAFVVIGCCDDKDGASACAAASPSDVPWIRSLKKSMTNCSCEISLMQGTYQSQTVFFIVLTDPLCDGINTPTLYDCQGKAIRSFTTSAEDQQELADNVTRDKVVYRCKD